jgi:hypothetical protein
VEGFTAKSSAIYSKSNAWHSTVLMERKVVALCLSGKCLANLPQRTTAGLKLEKGCQIKEFLSLQISQGLILSSKAPGLCIPFPNSLFGTERRI